ncbi:MAG: methyltransferase domain-containing protein [Planctomycetaceae bacterium]|nr:MAG: methyltransferase domain-containing protein [Planctomycetaceae bacterium]
MMELRSAEQLLEGMRGFQIPCVLAAAADLDLFQLLAATPRSARATAEQLGADVKAVTVLLDALAAIGVLVKSQDHYALAPAVAPFLLDDSPESVAAMLRHQANCLRHWARLPWIVQTGESNEGGDSIRGAQADQQSFIEAMHVVSKTVAQPLIDEINPGRFQCVLDIGGASGTWTAAWCRAEPTAQAILFDLPAVIPLAQQRLEEIGISHRVVLVPGDYHSDPLPRGADLVWLSAIIHQNSPEQNRALYHRIATALEPGGRLLIRDIVMEPSRTEPLTGALFAVNMLVHTEGGNCYTLSEIRDDLEAAGFTQVTCIRHDEGMNSVVSARRG